MALVVNNLPSVQEMQEIWVDLPIKRQEEPLEEEMAVHPNILA